MTLSSVVPFEDLCQIELICSEIVPGLAAKRKRLIVKFVNLLIHVRWTTCVCHQVVTQASLVNLLLVNIRKIVFVGSSLNIVLCKIVA